MKLIFSTLILIGGTAFAQSQCPNFPNFDGTYEVMVDGHTETMEIKIRDCLYLQTISNGQGQPELTLDGVERPLLEDATISAQIRDNKVVTTMRTLVPHKYYNVSKDGTNVYYHSSTITLALDSKGNMIATVTAHDDSGKLIFSETRLANRK